MYVNGVHSAPINDVLEYEDNWTRTFRGVPKFSKEELKMLHDWLKKKQLGEITLYLTLDKYRGLDDEMAELILRDLLRGIL